MAKRSNVGRNLLDMIPRRSPAFPWRVSEAGTVEIIVPRNGLLERLVRKIAKTPAALTVDLDDFGTFVWQAIDGQRNTQAIGLLVQEAFGEKAEPLYDRLGLFMQLLRNNRFIVCGYPSAEGE